MKYNIELTSDTLSDLRPFVSLLGSHASEREKIAILTRGNDLEIIYYTYNFNR